METHTTLATLEDEEIAVPVENANWVVNASLLWAHRRRLAIVGFAAFWVSMGAVCLIPKQYKSSASIMPPDSSGSGSLMLAALFGHSGSTGSGGLGGLGSLANGLLGMHNSTALYTGLLHSGTITGHILDRFDLQHVYHKRYRVDAVKHLVRLTKVAEDKKSGVLTITVEDTDRVRARDIAQAYLDELNKLVVRTNTSSAHRERVFIQNRLTSVKADLEKAQLALAAFSSTHTTIDIKEQTRAMVDASAKLQAQLLIDQSELGSLQQIYGSGNIRVRAAEARIGMLQKQLNTMSGKSTPLPADGSGDAGANSADNDTSVTPAASSSTDSAELYPSLRQIPRLAVPYADLYRRVRVEESIFELLTQQYELASVEEAKDIPIVSVIDAPGIAEKKAFPPRALLTLLLTFLTLVVVSAHIILRARWEQVDPADSRKILFQHIVFTVGRRFRQLNPRTRGAL